MWFEILPSLGIMWGALTLGMYGSQFVPWLVLGQRQYKQVYECGHIYMYHRDEQMAGGDKFGPYRQKGLEVIPDEAPENSS